MAVANPVADGYAVTYDELKTLIQQFSEVEEQTFVDNIPKFVTQAELLIYNEVELPAMRFREVFQPVPYTAGIAAYPIGQAVIPTAGVQIPPIGGSSSLGNDCGYCSVTLPSGFLSAFSVSVDAPGCTHKYLLQKDPEYIYQAFPYQRRFAVPTHYAILNQETMIMGPTSINIYPIWLDYEGYPASITKAGTSWLGTMYPNVLLFGSLMYAYQFLKGELDLLATYEKLFKEALAQLVNMGYGKSRRDVYRSTLPRYMVEPIPNVVGPRGG